MTTDKELNFLFLCTGNSARSVLGEAVVNHIDLIRDVRVRGYSAGSQPTGQVNPVALETLEAQGISTRGLRSKSWDEFAEPGAPEMDIIVTVCDNAAGETCPIWPGHPSTAHWGLPDPAAVEGPDEDKQAAFEAIFHILKDRLERVLEPMMEGSDAKAGLGDREALGKVLRELGGPVGCHVGDRGVTEE